MTTAATAHDLIADVSTINAAYEHAPSAKSIDLHYWLVPEESRELDEAMQEFRDGCASPEGPTVEQLAHMWKEAYDVAVVALSLIEMTGGDMGAICAACSGNNLEKVDATTGKVIRNEAGKVLKPAGWQPVDLTAHAESVLADLRDVYKMLGTLPHPLKK